MNIEEWLDNNNKTQMWLADQLGVTRAAVSAWVTGVSRPRPSMAIRIVALCDGVTMADLYG